MLKSDYIILKQEYQCMVYARTVIADIGDLKPIIHFIMQTKMQIFF